jgi:hypothetical protein
VLASAVCAADEVIYLGVYHKDSLALFYMLHCREACLFVCVLGNTCEIQQHVYLQGQPIACAVRACCIGCASK